MTKEKPQTTEQEHQEAAPTRTERYYFPNTQENAPFSCTASDLEEAEAQNKQHLQQQKENH